MAPSGFAFRSVARGDFSLLATWLAAPHVQPWWQEDYDPAGIEARYGPGVDGTDPGEVFVVERHGQPIGLIQRYRLDDNPDWQESLRVTGTPSDGVGIDYLIGEASLTGAGLGPALISQFLIGTWSRYPDVPAVVVSVNQDNRRSWRALEKAGFYRVWSGEIESDDPSDAGTSFVYVLDRPAP
ncbi:MAG TPA: GNAT family N-acetyltransferase [Acidimicrobiales bacterium]|nr:GNAT family N-acetyltransferase [Acidimicrobiales bacterium]